MRMNRAEAIFEENTDLKNFYTHQSIKAPIQETLQNSK